MIPMIITRLNTHLLVQSIRWFNVRWFNSLHADWYNNQYKKFYNEWRRWPSSFLNVFLQVRASIICFFDHSGWQVYIVEDRRWEDKFGCAWVTCQSLVDDNVCWLLSIIGLPQQTSKIVNPSLSLPFTQPIMPSLSANNFGFNFDSKLSFSEQISILSSACYYDILDLRRNRHLLDFTTATTIANSSVRSRVDFCNSLDDGLPITQTKCLQHIQIRITLAVTRTPNHFHITQYSSIFSGLKTNSAFNIRSFYDTQSHPYNRTKVPSQPHKYPHPAAELVSLIISTFPIHLFLPGSSVLIVHSATHFPTYETFYL